MPNKVITGRAHSVPCPHCAQGNDFTEIMEELSAGGVMGAGADRGQKVTCDRCSKDMVVVQIEKVTLVHVRQPQPGD